MTNGVELPEMPTFGRYQPLFRIAAGGMAEVYGARAIGEAGFQRWVALKRILPHLTDDARFVEMFLDEARLAANVQSAHVVPTLDLGRASDGSLYLVMEMIVGATFGSLLLGATRAGELLPVPLVLDIVAQSAQGLHDAHDARSPDGEPLNIVHRDVSPRNILVGLDGRARIVDFGIAQGELRATQTAIGEVKGTQAYFSPEQAALQKLDRRSDVYALGLVLWEALIGERLFGGNAFIETRAVVPRIDSVRPDLSPELADVVARSVQRDREARYQTAGELALALRGILGPVLADTATAEISSAVRKYGMRTIERIQSGMARSTLDRAPPGQDFASPKQGTTRLHAYGTSFIGREQDLARLDAILARGDRFVTLFGPGGVGKTRLAIELAERSRERFPGGVVFCDLSGARTADEVCHAVRGTLGVSSVQGREAGLETLLGRALSARGQTLVILDNVEQAIAHVSGTLGRWLVDAPRTTFLLTSRERLRLTAETVYELAPLELGTGSAAATLFLDRVTRVRRDLAIDEAAERAIATIVRRLDGLPLAIERAASRARVMDLAQLAEQPGERARMPSPSARDGSPRHASMDATIRWSWELLDPSEQKLFALVSVFRGGFDARAAADVAETAGGPDDVTHVLEQLVDKSLVRFVGGTSRRFDMLETAREFAGRELDELGATEEAMERHARYYGALAARADDARSAAVSSEVLRDLDNLVHAFGWTVEHRRTDDAGQRRALQLALAAEGVLGLRGPLPLAVSLLERAVLACDGGSDADLDARARLALARLLLIAGDPEAAGTELAEARLVATLARSARADAWVALTEAEQHWATGNVPRAIVASARAVAAAEEVGEPALLARAHFRMGTALHLRGDHEAAKESLERSRTIARTLKNEALEARADVMLADVLGDMKSLASAALLAESARARAVRTGDQALEARAARTLGTLARERNDAQEAFALFAGAVELTRESGDLQAEGRFLCCLGVAQEGVGLFAEARASHEAATEVSRRAQNRLGEGLAQTWLGRLLARSGEEDDAQRALGRAAAILREVGDRVGLVVVKLCTAHADLAKGDRAEAAGDGDGAAAHRDRARDVAAKVREEVARGWPRSLDVEHALVVLEADLDGWASRFTLRSPP